jgi:hypothetical protein
MNKEPFEKGTAFERYVETILFPDSHYELLEKTHDFEQNNRRFVGSTMNPDFKFKCRTTGLVFFVEAKAKSTH